MPENPHLEIVNAEVQRLSDAAETVPDTQHLRALATDFAKGLHWMPSVTSSAWFRDRSASVSAALKPVLREFRKPFSEGPVSDDARWLHDNLRLIRNEMSDSREALGPYRKTPHVRTSAGDTAPRAAAVAEAFLAAVGYQYTEQAFSAYLAAFQQTTMLNLKELWALVPAMKLALLQQITERGNKLLAENAGPYAIGVCVASLRDVAQTPWKNVLEPLIVVERVLREDPAGVYSQMDYDSRDLYRNRLMKIAEHSDCTEMDVAQEALQLARQAKLETYADPRIGVRRSHIGYYLVGEGRKLLYDRVGFKYPIATRIQEFLVAHPDEYYLTGIEVLTFAIVLAILLPLIGPGISLGLVLLAVFLLLLPCSQSAIQVMNYLTTAILRPQILPKLDFSDAIPDNCVTLVAVPTLLLNKEQVRRLVGDLEIRYLGNHDPNLHYALLSDLPDSRERAPETSPLIDLASELIRGLNEKYGERERGTFLMLHRHRVYNPRERVWMGWERKRGKLLDLNKLLRNQYDSFPVKVGDLSILKHVRFVITLDSDTELPRGSAHRMIGALAHPLNQAIIDPEKNIVTTGYGILQPRVGVSVQSASLSRLASIYSGETGFDIYTRAISDVYQDLYGEGIFTGKGIYEVETLHKVLDRRFPRNALLSHDLIEGSYARVGLATDIEVIEDYPSHYSAYNRRKHRWLRGDWQIAGWLRSRVPDEAGHFVSNPISIISQWKILDNLRRSLVEPATFLLLVFGWVALPGAPRYWTLATVAILFVPAWCEFLFRLVRSAVTGKAEVARDAWTGFLTDNVSVFLTLTFLAHQMLLSLDAVVRALVRRLVTRRRLLEWETAAEAELGVRKRTPVDRYLDWMPVLAGGIGVALWFGRRHAFYAALPILVLWACSKLISAWLNRPSHALHRDISVKDATILRKSALHIWRYFAEFSTEEHNWLIPDNVQEEPPAVAARVSPTNIGLLLNARQAACEFGYITVPEFAELTLRTLATISTLQHYRGHLLNWYDTKTLAPLPPAFVSSVDNGNLAASLWTLQQGALDRLRRPVVASSLAEGFIDHARSLLELRVLPRRTFANLRRAIRKDQWLEALLTIDAQVFAEIDLRVAKTKRPSDAQWFAAEARKRMEQIKQTVRSFTPWLLPEFAGLREDPALKFAMKQVALQHLPDLIDALAVQLQYALNSSDSGERKVLCEQLQDLLPNARTRVITLIQDLKVIAGRANKLAESMDFSFLLNPRRNLLSIGYDVDARKLHSACYDLLASEARTAVFVAITKEDIPQETWFLLGRAHTVVDGHKVLLSWTGTMFEYLMPSLWMRAYPNTLLERTRFGAVRAQQAYCEEKGVPWGISESAYFKMDDAGNYQYEAFGVPWLALREGESNKLVISPYSSFLALRVDTPAVLENLRKMASEDWFGSYGFYESADFTRSHRLAWHHRYELVRCWMAHHQGMSLLALANFLYDGVVQRWFHSDPRVQATELLLHEKPVHHVRAEREGYAAA